jgi:peptidoglycan/LPS O-acetylase OafA/YrhL
LKLRQRLAFVILFVGISWLTRTLAVAQTSGGAVTIRYTSISPFIALLAGILILIMPRLLNYIVAVYLILVGLIGIFGR